MLIARGDYMAARVEPVATPTFECQEDFDSSRAESAAAQMFDGVRQMALMGHPILYKHVLCDSQVEGVKELVKLTPDGHELSGIAFTRVDADARRSK